MSVSPPRWSENASPLDNVAQHNIAQRGATTDVRSITPAPRLDVSRETTPRHARVRTAQPATSSGIYQVRSSPDVKPDLTSDSSTPHALHGDSGWTPIAEDVAWLDPVTLAVHGRDRHARLVPGTLERSSRRMHRAHRINVSDGWSAPLTQVG